MRTRATPTYVSDVDIVIPGHAPFVRAEVLRGVYATPLDFVVLSGSLVEGIGGRYSDFDIHMVCDELPAWEVARHGTHYRVHDDPIEIVCAEGARIRGVHDCLGEEGLQIDVQYHTREEVEVMFDDIEDGYAFSQRTLRTLTRTLPSRHAQLFHRIASGVVVQPGAVNYAERAKAMRAKFCYLAHAHCAGDFGNFKDVLGAVDGGRWDQAVLWARSFVTAELQGLSLLAGSTRSATKWILPTIQDIPDELPSIKIRGRELVVGASESPGEALDYVRRCCGLVDEIWQAELDLLEREPSYRSPKESIAMALRELSEKTVSNPQANLEYVFRVKRYLRDSIPLHEFIGLKNGMALSGGGVLATAQRRSMSKEGR